MKTLRPQKLENEDPKISKYKYKKKKIAKNTLFYTSSEI